MKQLSENLKPIYELELELGNVVDSIDEPAGTKCPLAVNFRNFLHVTEIQSQLPPLNAVEFWENRDSHYPAQNGFQCTLTGHVIAGPLPNVRTGW